MCYVIVTRAESPRVFIVKGYEKEDAIRLLGYALNDVWIKCLADFEVDCLDSTRSVILEL
jgi:hypothetical protein